MFRFRLAVFFALSEAIIPGAAFSQSIGTDRPDFVESSSTVGKGSVQIEGSVAFDETTTPARSAPLWKSPSNRSRETSAVVASATSTSEARFC